MTKHGHEIEIPDEAIEAAAEQLYVIQLGLTPHDDQNVPHPKWQSAPEATKRRFRVYARQMLEHCAKHAIFVKDEQPKYFQPEFANELVLRMQNGMQLRCENTAQKADKVSYIRVCDPSGDEVVYWSIDEIREDPSGVMGAIVGSLFSVEYASGPRYELP